jgi:uncharacterized protein GlcG (DUF336 family)
MRDILDAAGNQVVNADNRMAGIQKVIAQMAAQKARTACNHNAHGTPPGKTQRIISFQATI